MSEHMNFTLYNRGTGFDQHLDYTCEWYGSDLGRDAVAITIPVDLGAAGDCVVAEVPAKQLRAVMPPVLPFLVDELVLHPDHAVTVHGKREGIVCRIVELDEATALIQVPGKGQTRVAINSLVRPRTMKADQ